jgi:hypothetical protein
MNLTTLLAHGLSSAIDVDKSPPLFDVYEPPPPAEESSSDTRHWRDSSLTRQL